MTKPASLNRGKQTTDSAIAQRKGHAGKPSPTILTCGFCPGNNAPLNERGIANHTPNDRPVCGTFNSDGRVVVADDVAPTVFAQSISPLDERRALNNDPNDYRPRKFNSASRVQSFPDWYCFQGSQADGFRQVGNAVPPLYARQLALALLEYDERKVL